MDVAGELITLSAPGADIPLQFPPDESIVHRLLEGLDDIGLTLRHEPEITTFEQTRPGWMPVTN